MREMARDDLPERWQEMWNEMNIGPSADEPNLQDWLEEVYFDDRKKPDMTRDDIARLGRIISRLLHFEPSARASARQVLDDPWFND